MHIAPVPDTQPPAAMAFVHLHLLTAAELDACTRWATTHRRGNTSGAFFWHISKALSASLRHECPAIVTHLEAARDAVALMLLASGQVVVGREKP